MTGRDVGDIEMEIDEPPRKEPKRDCEYFRTVIRPMLAVGHEGELCEWMKGVGLLKREWRCTNDNCEGIMTWSKARVVDKFNWACPHCARKISIREGSFFVHIKCGLQLIFQAILNWCEQITVATSAINLGLKDHVVKKIYDRCTEVASKYVDDHSKDWLLGGENAVVVIDVYPDGYMTSSSFGDSIGRKNLKKILCIADTSCIPARIWAKVLDQEPQVAAQEAINYVSRQVRPGSTLVANERVTCCPYNALCQLKSFPSIISVETLMGLDLPGTRRVQENLETIWNALVGVCHEVRDLPKKTCSSSLNEFMWRQMFGSSSSTALESIINQIAEQYSKDDD